MPETNPRALTIFGAVAAVGAASVTAWVLAAEHPVTVVVPLLMGTIGVGGGVVTARRSWGLWWLGVACGVVLLVMAFWRLRDFGVYYLPFGMLLAAMGQVVLRERVSNVRLKAPGQPHDDREGRPK